MLWCGCKSCLALSLSSCVPFLPINGAGSPMSLKTCCSHHLRTAGWTGTRRPSWPSHALYLRRTSTKTYWVGAPGERGVWVQALNNSEGSWSTSAQQRCWAKDVYYPNASQDVVCTDYWQVIRKKWTKRFKIHQLQRWTWSVWEPAFIFCWYLSSVLLLSCGLTLTALVPPLLWACHHWDKGNILKPALKWIPRFRNKFSVWLQVLIN